MGLIKHYIYIGEVPGRKKARRRGRQGVLGSGFKVLGLGFRGDNGMGLVIRLRVDF